MRNLQFLTAFICYTSIQHSVPCYCASMTVDKVAPFIGFSKNRTIHSQWCVKIDATVSRSEKLPVVGAYWFDIRRYIQHLVKMIIWKAFRSTIPNYMITVIPRVKFQWRKYIVIKNTTVVSWLFENFIDGMTFIITHEIKKTFFFSMFMLLNETQLFVRLPC